MVPPRRVSRCAIGATTAAVGTVAAGTLAGLGSLHGADASAGLVFVGASPAQSLRPSASHSDDLRRYAAGTGVAAAALAGRSVTESCSTSWGWLASCAGVVAGLATAAGRLRSRAGFSWRRGAAAKGSDGSTPLGAESRKATTVPPVWVVNLDKSTERWQRCREEFDSQGVKAERFPATLGRAMSEEELKEKCTWGARYFCTPGMIGCFMSHLRIWEKVVKEGHPAVVVLEDDVVLYPKFNDRLQTLLSELPADWDVCLLGAVGCIAPVTEAWYMKIYALITGGGRPSPGKTRGVSPNVYVPYRPAGTHAYMISQKGASELRKLCPKPRYHVDLTAWSRMGLKLYSAKDFLATQRFGDDTTVSKQGAPLTKRFLIWSWDIMGLSHMGKRGGLPNLNWAWTTAVFALPVPFNSTRRRIIVELGPASSLFVLIVLLCIPLRSLKPLGVGLLYLNSIISTIRWLAGTTSLRVTSGLALAGAGLIWLG